MIFSTPIQRVRAILSVIKYCNAVTMYSMLYFVYNSAASLIGKLIQCLNFNVVIFHMILTYNKFAKSRFQKYILNFNFKMTH